MTNAETLEQQWGLPLQTALCPQCDRRYLASQLSADSICPMCRQEKLQPLEDLSHLYLYPPEQYLPPKLNDAELAAIFRKFRKGIPFTPSDLTAANLRARLQLIYLPVWLVDSDVFANWQAETGFIYQAKSHREMYRQGNWHTEEQVENRTRWEPRLGQLTRHYDNVAAPALEAHRELRRKLGSYDLSTAQAYDVSVADAKVIALPSRSTEDAWEDALYGFQQRAGEECRQAAQADYIRDFQWQPTFSNQNWSQLLAPVYTTCYRNDNDQAQYIHINAQTGKAYGLRQASMKRAKNMAIILTVIAGVLFNCTLLSAVGGFFLDPALTGLAVLGLLMTIFGAMTAVIPLIVAWQFNQSQKLDADESD